MTESRFEETPASPYGAEPHPTPPPEEARAHEPVFNAPWQAVAVTLLILGGYGLQTFGQKAAIEQALGFVPSDLAQGRWQTLFTANFVHGAWAHALGNAAFALVFATPLARFFGPRVEGGLKFFVFYVACGVLGYLAFGLLDPTYHRHVIGASVAISGLVGGTARLMGGDGRVGPLFSRPVLTLGVLWTGSNLATAWFGGTEYIPGFGNAAVAWPAHIAGFFVGVILIGMFGRVVRPEEG